MRIEIEVRGAERAAAQFKRASRQITPALDRGLYAWAQDTRAYLKAKPYPSQSHPRMIFKSERQRKYFFWALRTGKLRVPYRRTGKLANSFKVERGGGMVRILNTAEYAEGVIGSRQWRMHRDTWWRMKRVLAGRYRAIPKYIDEAIQKELPR